MTVTHNRKDVEHEAVARAHGVFEVLQRERAAVKRKGLVRQAQAAAGDVSLKASVFVFPFRVQNVEFVFCVLLFAHVCVCCRCCCE